MIAIIDLGSQYTHLIARRIKELGVSVRIYPPSNFHPDMEVKGVILSGGPGDVETIQISENLLDSGVPVLGICLGMHYLAKQLGGSVDRGKREYGSSDIRVVAESRILKNTRERFKVWMSHQYEVQQLPEEIEIIAKSKDIEIATFEKGDIFGLQFHPEVSHTEYGKTILKNFIMDICQEKKRRFNPSIFVKREIREIKERAGDYKIIAGVSGGVDSSVMAFLLKEAIGERFIPVFVDTGLLRKGEEEDVRENLSPYLSIKFIRAEKEFLSVLKGVSNPEEKRRRIGRKFIEIFSSVDHNARFLAQGTLYPDRIESLPQIGKSSTIKTHHNVGGLPEDMPFQLIEPLRDLFKDEVRKVGRVLHLPDKILARHPFPGPGLAVRILGQVTMERVKTLQEADYILIRELREKNLYNKIWQAFCVLLPVLTVGVMGDERTYEYALVVRAVVSKDGMTASAYRFRWDDLISIGDKIVREVDGVNRVSYDITSKPPGTIEWE